MGIRISIRGDGWLSSRLRCFLLSRGCWRFENVTRFRNNDLDGSRLRLWRRLRHRPLKNSKLGNIRSQARNSCGKKKPRFLRFGRRQCGRNHRLGHDGRLRRRGRRRRRRGNNFGRWGRRGRRRRRRRNHFSGRMPSARNDGRRGRLRRRGRRRRSDRNRQLRGLGRGGNRSGRLRLWRRCRGTNRKRSRNGNGNGGGNRRRAIRGGLGIQMKGGPGGVGARSISGLLRRRSGGSRRLRLGPFDRIAAAAIIVSAGAVMLPITSSLIVGTGLLRALGFESSITFGKLINHVRDVATFFT